MAAPRGYSLPMSVQVRSLSKVYRNPFSRKPPLEAVRGVSFRIGSGEIYALLGPNGAGKSTIVKMLAGLIVPTSGSILLNEKKLSGRDAKTYKELSAVLEGIRNVYWRLTPLENLHYFANLRGVRSSLIKERALSLLQMLDIDAKKANQSQHLSRGMLQKLALATALITDPDILLLDEPILGLDVESARRIKDVLLGLAREEGKTILLTTHQMDLVEELADRVGILRRGELIREGTLAELKSIFKSYVYRFKIKGKFRIPAEWKKYNARIDSERPDATEIEVDCKNNAGVYQIIAALKRGGREIIALERMAEDLENLLLMVLAER